MGFSYGIIVSNCGELILQEFISYHVRQIRGNLTQNRGENHFFLTDSLLLFDICQMFLQKN